jgi:hypothetical protein
MLGIALVLALTFGVGFTTEFAKSDLGAVAFAGLFSAIYLAGMQFFPANGERLHMIALLGGIGVGVTAIVLSFESSWHMTRQFFWGDRTLAANIAFALEFLFPLAAIILAVWSFIRRRFQFSLAAAVFPLVTALALGLVNVCETPAAQYIYPTTCSFVAAGLMNGYVLWLGSDILIRGIRANSVARANFGLLLIAALALSRFFDSQLSFVTRGLGFIVVGAGFLIANILLFKKRSTAVAAA